MALHDRPVLVAPDSFKGTLSAHQVAVDVATNELCFESPRALTDKVRRLL